MVLRAMRFFECLSQIVEAGGEGDRVLLSTRLMQLVAVDFETWFATHPTGARR